MSTLPFLLSVADELDNLNSQSYMDDFGLGFHPHRQYYRTPTIQLSLPASTDWMQDERQRCRTHKFVFETQNNLQAAPDAAEDEEAGNDDDAADTYVDKYGEKYGGGASTSTGSRQKYTSALNSNERGGGGGIGGASGAAGGRDGDEDDNIDNSVQMYNLSKKCCKNYHRHGEAHSAAPTAPPREKPSEGGYKLHTKCMEGNNSSSDESLQKVSSSIEFLTCFLVKKSRTPKNAPAGSGKKS